MATDCDLSSTEAYLIPYPIESFSKPVPLGMGRTTIGREASNTIQIAHESVAPRHARISFSNGGYLLTEINPDSGTFVNGKRTVTVQLRHHDKISFGKRAFLFLQKSRPILPAGKRSLAQGEKVLTILEEDLDPSELLAQEASGAVREIFNPPETQSEDEPEINALAHRRLSLLYQLSENLRSTQSLDQMLNKGLELVLNALNAAERAMILLGAHPSDNLEVGVVRHRHPHESGGAFPISRTVVDWVLSEKMVLVSQNLGEDTRFQDADSIRVHNIHAILVVPLMKEGRVVGVLYVEGRSILQSFNRPDVAFVAAVANELALCIENVRLQKELIQNERMAAIGLTMSNLAHNIKNLLALNQNAVDLLGMQLKQLEDRKIDKSWRYILQSFTRINNLAVNMLAFTKEQQLALRPARVNRIILAGREAIEQSLSNKGIQLHLKLDENDPEWMIDADQFQRILLNLLVNAIDAVKHKPDGRIEICTAVDDAQRLNISVSDNGSGIAADKMSRIFDLFYTTKGTAGSGLGLAMVRKFVEQMGGTITIETTENAGATFNLIFPEAAPGVGPVSSGSS